MDQLDNTPAAFWMTCNEEQEGKAKKRCSKHLGAEMANGNAEDSTFFEDCVYDVCHGAGEAATLRLRSLLTYHDIIYPLDICSCVDTLRARVKCARPAALVCP